MSTETRQIVVGGVTVQVIRKAIKNLHLGVYPPNGRVRVAAPLRVSDSAVRLAVVDKLGWIKRQRAKFEAQPRQSVREMVSGESHYLFGRRYRLRVVHGAEPPTVKIRGRWIELRVSEDMTLEKRSRLLQEWYRLRLLQRALPLVQKWELAIGVHLADWGIKRMKTRWGTCNPGAGRIWLNLELAKKPAPCLEYLVVHELVHLIERTHNERFIALMEEHLPDWKARRTLLNAQPLAHDTWAY
jgi:predicted metal-dependent hydrolase